MKPRHKEQFKSSLTEVFDNEHRSVRDTLSEIRQHVINAVRLATLHQPSAPSLNRTEWIINRAHVPAREADLLANLALALGKVEMADTTLAGLSAELLGTFQQLSETDAATAGVTFSGWAKTEAASIISVIDYCRSILLLPLVSESELRDVERILSNTNSRLTVLGLRAMASEGCANGLGDDDIPF